jgi:two-component system, response regulator FlrC
MRLLIIGSLGGQIGAASQIAMQRGAQVTQADDVDHGLQTLRAGGGADLIMIDVEQDVGRLIENLESERIIVPVVACGTGTDTKAAVKAIKAGAKEYIPLPPSAELIAAVLSAITEESHAIIHADPSMADVLHLADQVAQSEADILITGPSGTGKELLARYLHEKSRRGSKKFVAINCAAIPENLLESELFGHEKGAFTGAVARRLGKFEEADGGTLLLDEISEMDPRLQAKLLRAVQEREIDRVGSTKPVKVNVRIVATSNRDMQEEIAQGTFREDLYYRLNVVNLVVPALAERPADIPVLAEHFIDKYAEANGFEAKAISAAAHKKLGDYAWPGNVRELENTMHRTVLLAQGDEIGPDSILLSGHDAGHPAGATAAPNAASLVGRTVAEVERDLIIDTLHHCLGNRTHAANILGISIRTLRNKLKQYSEGGFAVPVPGAGERPTA